MRGSEGDTWRSSPGPPSSPWCWRPAVPAAVAPAAPAAVDRRAPGPPGRVPRLTASAPGITPTTITIGSHQPLTGPAAPGYSEIAPAANAYFQYVNAHGGVFGRKIVYKYLERPVQPHEDLERRAPAGAAGQGLRDLQRARHADPPRRRAVPERQKVPDVFVASGCECWNDPTKLPDTFGWQLDYVREGKILGNYIKQHFKGKKIGYFFQNDEFGQDGVKGLEIGDPQVPGRRQGDL